MTKRSDSISRSVRRNRRGTSSLRSGKRPRGLRFEPLEERRLLSVAVGVSLGQTHPPLGVSGASGPAAVFDYVVNQPIRGGNSGITPAATSAYTPSQIQTAYGISGIAGNGQGQTIAIIDAYNDSDIVNDAATFNGQFGLQPFNSGGPTFTVLNENGGTSLANVPPSGTSGSSDWSLEESLDVEWRMRLPPRPTSSSSRPTARRIRTS